MNDRSKLIDDSVARHISRASCFGVLPRNRASTSCFGVVRRRLASESCVGVLLRNDSTRLRYAVTSRGVWGQTAKYVIDKHPGLCFATNKCDCGVFVSAFVCFSLLNLLFRRGSGCDDHHSRSPRKSGCTLWQGQQQEHGTIMPTG
jgi:hypothetical protein